MNIVTSYTNPDLDGVGSALGYAAWTKNTTGTVFVPAVAGRLDDETQLVLKMVGATPPLPLGSWDNIEWIALVDTHHVRQLPAGLPLYRVVDIVDHHPGGDLRAFPRAAITNEFTGAAATIIAERLRAAAVQVPITVMQCLAAAIWSNTLGLTAPSVSMRDRSSFDWLTTAWPLPTGLLEAMAERRRTMLGATTLELLTRDVKLFEALGGVLAISQVEAPNAGAIAGRPDLHEVLAELRHTSRADFVLLNLVDTNIRRTTFVSADPDIIDTLITLGVRRIERYVATSNTTILRKFLVSAFIEMTE